MPVPKASRSLGPPKRRVVRKSLAEPWGPQGDAHVTGRTGGPPKDARSLNSGGSPILQDQKITVQPAE